MSDRSDSQRAAFDDDRLLDYALGLDDDPELAAALSRSARLRERLADLKSDLAAIETELRRGFPPLDESYPDLSSSRWSRLRHSLGEPAAVRRRPRSGRRLTAALVAAALALALAIGLVTILTRNPASSSNAGSSASSAGKSAVRSPASSLAAGAAQPAAAGAAAAATAAQAATYRDVAVVRAGPLRGASQSFTVVRTLKGSPPASFSLVLQAIGNAPQAGSLAVAYLRPLATTAPAPSATSASPYSFDSQPALVVALPAGVPAAAVRLP
jgi:hypothetical protein